MSHPVDQRAVIALRALAYPVRLGIMQELAKSPETYTCDFTEIFAVAQPKPTRAASTPRRRSGRPASG